MPKPFQVIIQIVMVKFLRLQEHKHTAKRLPHAHTSYRGLWLILFCVGLAMFLIQRATAAESYVVNAKVPAPIPSTPAQIDNPKNNTVLESPNIVVSGNCPIIVPAIIVGIYSNNNLVGSGGCSAAGQFFATVHLSPGANILEPRVYTITNDGGPVGDPISITFVLGVSTTAATTGREKIYSASSQSGTVLHIKSSNPFVLYKSGQAVKWPVYVEGGRLPYVFSIDWGDGVKTGLTANSVGLTNLEHIFNGSGSYLVRLTVRDTSGQTVSTSVAAVTSVNSPAVFGVVGSVTPAENVKGLSGAIIAYFAVIICVIAFWAGAKYELQLFKSGKKKP